MQGGGGFQLGEGRAGAYVGPVAEGEVLALAAGAIELARIRPVLSWVAAYAL